MIPLEKWFSDIKKKIIVAGPCSVESPTQLLTTAQEISSIKNVQVFRAGIWKPRTRPHTFQGIGVKGLPWLYQVKKNYGLKIMTEVATSEQVIQCLKYKVDMLWIGAKTTTDPLAVQAIADALQGVDIPIWIKNPVIPDIYLWMGALERIQMAGLKKIGLIFRGFFPTTPTKYRNTPNWDMIRKFKKKNPLLPVLIDPSHMAGKASYISTIMEQYVREDINGWMIECHYQPKQALSDASQQVTPQTLQKLLSHFL